MGSYHSAAEVPQLGAWGLAQGERSEAQRIGTPYIDNF